MPQVWETQEGLLITDGNNRCLRYASLGLREIEVEYCQEEDTFGFLLNFDEIRNSAKMLRQKLVYTPYDLCRTRDGLVFE